MTKPDPSTYFRISREIIRPTVVLYLRFPLSMRYVEGPLHERGIYFSHESVWSWWQRFGPMFAA